MTGRWPSRDPIGERGGINLYVFIKNRAIQLVDILGRENYPSEWFPFGDPNPVVQYADACLSGSEKPYNAMVDSLTNRGETVDFSEDARYRRWYERKFPKTTKAILDKLRSEIESVAASRICQNTGVIPNSLLIGASAENYSRTTEADWGDKPQNVFESSFILGRYGFEPKFIGYSDELSCMCDCYEYFGVIDLTDTLGYDPDNAGDNMGGLTDQTWDFLGWLSFGPERPVTIARWPVRGIICCPGRL